MPHYTDEDMTYEELLACYTSPIPKESQVINDKVSELVVDIHSSLINTYGILPTPDDISNKTYRRI